MIPKFETEIRVLGSVGHGFVWAVQVKSDNPADAAGSFAGQEHGYLTARQKAIDCCKRLAVSALRPVISGSVLTLKLKDEDFLRQAAVAAENPSGADLSRERTA